MSPLAVILGCVEPVRFLQNSLQPLAINQVQQLQRRTAGLLLADFPLLHGGNAGVEHSSEDGLADLRILADQLDLACANVRHGEMAQRFVLVHAALADHTSPMQACGRLVDFGKNAALADFVSHGLPPQVRRLPARRQELCRPDQEDLTPAPAAREAHACRYWLVRSCRNQRRSTSGRLDWWRRWFVRLRA